jgi:hemoglobin
LTTTLEDRPRTPFERLGGTPTLRRIVDRFYDLMDSDAAYAELRAMHGADLGPMRESLTGFFTGWSGGPRDWFGQGKCVMGLHRPLGVTAETARQWIMAMGRAVDEELAQRDPDLARAMVDALHQMAMGMAPGVTQGAPQS